MAQIIVKGFVSKEVQIDKVGQKQVERARLSVVDDSRSKKVGFFIDFWEGDVKLVSFLKKGNRVIVKAYVDDGSYEIDDKEKGGGAKKKIFALNYKGFDVVRIYDNTSDLDSEFERCKQASSSHPELTPVSEDMPAFPGDTK